MLLHSKHGMRDIYQIFEKKRSSLNTDLMYNILLLNVCGRSLLPVYKG